MKTKLLHAARNIRVLILLVTLSLFAISLANPQPAYARLTCEDDPTISNSCPNRPGTNCPGGVNVCSDDYAYTCVQKTDCDIVKKYVNPMIRFLILFVGIAVVAGLILGSMEYMTSSSEPQKVQKAKDRIRAAIIALVTYVFLYALLRFLFPGDWFII